MKCVSRDDGGTRPFLEPQEGDPDTRVWVERDPPLQVYCDYEALTEAEGCGPGQRQLKRHRPLPQP